MPCYERMCPLCGGEKEVILRMSERDKEIICETCHIVMIKKISLPAKTAGLWDGGWRNGMSGAGFFSPSLGTHVSSPSEERKIMESRGFVAESDMGKGFIDDHIQKQNDRAERQDRINKTYLDNLNKFGGDKVKAVTETFPAEQMLKGDN